MNYINYINILLIPGAYALTFAPISFPLLIGLIGGLAVISFTFTTVSQIISVKRTNRKNRVIASIEAKRLKLEELKEELEECLSEKTQTASYTDLKRTNEVYSNIMESQSKELQDMKKDIEGLYRTLKEIDIHSSASSSYANHLEDLPLLFDEEDFNHQRKRKSSISLHKRRLGVENEEQAAKSI